jgi:RimJ/RimL family protein N-acetyltransferase
MAFAELPPPLPADLLEGRVNLPLKPAPVTLTGRAVYLTPLDLAADVAPLYAVSNGTPCHLGDRQVDAYDPEPLIWRYMAAGPFATLAEFRAYCVNQVDAPDARCLCVRDAATGHPVGMTNLMSNHPGHLKIELGGIWYSPLVQRTPANLQATYLMLRHAFGLGYQRVEWKCHVLNERSRRAALRMGFRFEGIQERHMIMKGRSRDTAWYRILADEWPAVEALLLNIL